MGTMIGIILQAGNDVPERERRFTSLTKKCEGVHVYNVLAVTLNKVSAWVLPVDEVQRFKAKLDASKTTSHTHEALILSPECLNK